MAKKNLAQLADLNGMNDVRPASEKCVKFVSTRHEVHFNMRVIGEDGKPEFHTDANGNNKLPTFKTFSFTPVMPHKDPATGKINLDDSHCFFIADPDQHGKDFQPIIDRLNELRKNPINQMFTDEEYFKRRNPEAFRIAGEMSSKDSKIDEQQRRIQELENRLGFNKPKQG
jgi:hypothetical protein